ncbi:MAG: ADP-forming succinate--CoA ligase subunit beta [Limnochordaceae bacterium]|nr:ADP-forming succinate--CoA ligase subunit beta [Limnochordaceae bacterium]
MRLTEAQSKAIFRDGGLPVPDGRVASSPDEVRQIAGELGGRVAVKVQIPIGGRGKAGGIRIAATPDDAARAASELIGARIRGYEVRQVLVERAAAVQREYYLSVTVDRSRQAAVAIFSTAGGMDIEEVAEKTPHLVAKEWADPLLGLRDFQVRRLFEEGGAPAEVRKELARFARILYELFRRHDAQLVEINPLAQLQDGTLLALDGKVEIDDNALFRHPDLAAMREVEGDHPLERAAREQHLAYVKLDGNVGIIGNGAGLVMATLDMVQREGGRPANFLDIGGGARADVVERALRIVLSDPDVKSVLINVFGGITRGDEVARGMLQALGQLERRSVPIVVRLAGTRAEEGRALLAQAGRGIETAPTFQQAARRVVELAAGA